MKSMLKMIIAGTILLAAGLTNHQEAEAAKITSSRNTVKVSSQFNDGRFNTVSFDAGQSYRTGIKLWTGDVVEKVIIRNNVSFNQAAKESDVQKYYKAQNASLRNQLVVKGQRHGVEYAPIKLNYGTQQAFNNNQIFNTYKFNQMLLQLVNNERRAKGLRVLTYAKNLQQGADIRSTELAQYGHISVDGIPHVRLNKARFSTAFNIPNAAYKVGENSAMNFFRGNPYEVVSEKYMAEKFFAQWKASSEHYKNMMRKDYKTMAASIKVSQFNRIEEGHYSYFYGTQAFSR